MSLTENLSRKWKYLMNMLSNVSAGEWVLYAALAVVLVCVSSYFYCCMCAGQEGFDPRIGIVSRRGKSVYGSEHMGNKSIFGRGSGYTDIVSAPSVASRSEHMGTTGSLYRASNDCVNGVYSGAGTEPADYCKVDTVTIEQARQGLSDYANAYDNLSKYCKNDWNASGGNDRSVGGGAFKQDRYKYGCDYF